MKIIPTRLERERLKEIKKINERYKNLKQIDGGLKNMGWKFWKKEKQENGIDKLTQNPGKTTQRGTKIMVECKGCGKRFTTKLRGAKTRQYCTNECGNRSCAKKYYNIRHNIGGEQQAKYCQECGKTITRKTKSVGFKRNFCSNACYFTARDRERYNKTLTAKRNEDSPKIKLRDDLRKCVLCGEPILRTTRNTGLARNYCSKRCIDNNRNHLISKKKRKIEKENYEISPKLLELTKINKKPENMEDVIKQLEEMKSIINNLEIKSKLNIIEQKTQEMPNRVVKRDFYRERYNFYMAKYDDKDIALMKAKLETKEKFNLKNFHTPKRKRGDYHFNPKTLEMRRQVAYISRELMEKRNLNRSDAMKEAYRMYRHVQNQVKSDTKVNETPMENIDENIQTTFKEND
jgi:endogenous inhibitor of DNA gyrase (YacG/DUF329 family)